MHKFHIKQNSTLGRSVITAETVKAGDVVVQETPFAYGPKPNSPIICLGCYKYLNYCNDGEFDRCDKCDWPLCSTCADSIDHSTECVVFSTANATFAGNVAESGICPQLDCITPLRVLLAKEKDNERWEEEIIPMEYHDKARRQMKEIWNADRINIAQYLRGPCKLADRFSEKLIMQVVGILEVNAFEARTPLGFPFRCLYPITGILAHNCVPNTLRSIYPSEGFKIRLRAMVDLEEGQQLQHSYTYTLNGTTQRQEHLRLGKFFTCRCERCKDPTELDTNFSTFKCTKCKEGHVLPSNPTEIIESVPWICNSCKFKTSSDKIQKAVTIMQAEVIEVESMDMGTKRIEATEKLLKKFKSVLHPLHFIQTGLRQNLIEMYGRVEGYEMISLSNDLLQRKEKLCRQVVQVLNVFEPGLSRTRAMILYEQHVPLVLLAKAAFVAELISREELKIKLFEAISILNECVSTLKYEDPLSQEGMLGQVAMQALEQLTIGMANL